MFLLIRTIYPTSLWMLLGLLLSGNANAELYELGPDNGQLPDIILEAEYDYYGENGKLSKLNNRHLRPPHALPVSTSAIIDQLNHQLDKYNRPAPEVHITDRLRWGRFELYTVLSPLSGRRKIARQMPVICRSKYDCLVDRQFEIKLSSDQINLLKWVQHQLASQQGGNRLDDPKVAEVTQSYKLFSITDTDSQQQPAINLWLNLKLFSRPQRILISADGIAPKPDRPALQVISQLIKQAHSLPRRKLRTDHPQVVALMQHQLQTPFAAQLSFPFSRMRRADNGLPRFQKLDLNGTELLSEMQHWHSLTPVGYLDSNGVRHLLFSLNDDPGDLHLLPVDCGSGLCNRLHADLLRGTEYSLLNHPLVLNQLASYLAH
ncbi:hypothetical protein [Marinobacterium arenosum]|uniref:hypothetical protein n=1 Tax=Marinobacterium arenosum TaxID=2862496 RepID=UPI001C978D0A|nr:hypothetical protein [Marinobacterium arenosum]MBY4676648.1 hypothetical protein [Marinobacterium arenosum]